MGHARNNSPTECDPDSATRRWPPHTASCKGLLPAMSLLFRWPMERFNNSWTTSTSARQQNPTVGSNVRNHRWNVYLQNNLQYTKSHSVGHGASLDLYIVYTTWGKRVSTKWLRLSIKWETHCFSMFFPRGFDHLHMSIGSSPVQGTSTCGTRLSSEKHLPITMCLWWWFDGLLFLHCVRCVHLWIHTSISLCSTPVKCGNLLHPQIHLEQSLGSANGELWHAQQQLLHGEHC